MKIFDKVSNFNFFYIKRQMAVASVILVAICFGSFFKQGFALGLDFTGGILLEVNYKQDLDTLNGIRTTLKQAGFTDAAVQRFGTPRDALIRLGPRTGQDSTSLSNKALAALQQVEASKPNGGNSVELRRVEYVGPQVGSELIEEAGLAILYSLIGILIYVAMRFEYRFAVGAIVATVHDVIITLGVFSLWQIEFDLTVLAAVLAVIGYSLNDTIIVFDRIRENFRRVRKGTVLEIINLSLNETLSRTMITSGTTVLTVLALFIFGGEIIHSFALALLVGIFVGTYSSIYVASASVIALGISRANLIVPKHNPNLDGMP